MKTKIIKEILQRLSDEGFINTQLTEINTILNDILDKYELNRKNLHTENINDFLINKYLLTKKVEGCSIKTIKYYKLILSVYKRVVTSDFRNVTTDDIRNFLNFYQSERKASNMTLDNIRRVLSSFYNWMEEEDYIVKNPMKKIHKIKSSTLLKDVFNDEQIEVLRLSVNTRIRENAMQELLLSSGIRVGELVSLNRDSVDFQEMSCLVKGKGDKERIVYFNVKTKVALLKYLNTRTDNHKTLFKTLHKNKRLTINAVEAIFKRIGKLAKIKNVYPHKYRRTMATKAIEKGMPIEQIQKLLGHSKIDTTLHYTMIKQDSIKLAHRKFIG